MDYCKIVENVKDFFPWIKELFVPVLKNINLKIQFKNYLMGSMRGQYRDSTFKLALMPVFEECNNVEQEIDNISQEVVFQIKKEDRKLICITGESGSGKTKTVKYICKELSKKYLIAFIRGKEVTDSIFNTLFENYGQFDSFFSKIIKNKNSWSIISEKYISNRKPLVIVLDGYNDICSDTDDKLKQKVDDEIERICKGCDNIYIIITNVREPSCVSEVDCKVYKSKEIKEENREIYLKECGINNRKSEIQILRYPHLMYMYIASKHGGVQNSREVRNVTDLYWNYNCYLSHQTNEIAFWFIAPIIAKCFETNKVRKLSKSYVVRYLEEHRQYNEQYAYPIYREIREKRLTETEYLELLIKFLILEERGDTLWFYHDTFRNFYIAVYEYNQTRCCIQNNVYVEPDVTIPDPIGKFYFEFWDEYTLEGLRYCENEDCGINTRIKYYSTLSDLYYYGNGSNIQRDLNRAMQCLQIPIQLNDGWAVWSCGYMMKEKAKLLLKEKEDEAANKEFGKCYFMIEEYIKRNESDCIYAAVYDLLAQFYINNWFPVSEEKIEERKRIQYVITYLEYSEKKRYVYSINKHGSLYEEGKIELKVGENKYNKAYDYYKEASKSDEPWAIARVGLYMWKLWEEIDELKILYSSSKEAIRAAEKYLEEKCRQFDEGTEILTGERLTRFKNCFMNLVWIYLEYIDDGENEEENIRKCLKCLKTVYFIEMSINKVLSERSVLLLLYIQIKKNKGLIWEKIKYISENDVKKMKSFYNHKTSDDYKEYQKKLGFDKELQIYNLIIMEMGKEYV